MKLAADFALPIDAVTETFGILAKKGAGKSNVAVVMAEEMYDAGVPWVAVDPKGDWWGLRSSADGKAAGLRIVVFGGRHGDVPLEPTAGSMLADLILAENLTCVLDVSEFSKAETTRFLLAFAERLYRQAQDEPLHLFLEEAHEYLPQRVGGAEAPLVGAWQRIVKQGRFKGLGCTLVSQRSASLNKDVLTQVDTLIVLRTTSPQDRAAVKAWVDVHPGAGAMLDTLPSLKDGEAWVWSPEALGILQQIQFRRRRTFDSGATPKVGEKRRAPATIADVDLAAIKEQMAETIERAKADDPAELRKRIRQLERDLAAASKAKSEPERIEVPVEVPFLPETVLDATTLVRKALGQLEEAIDAGTNAAPRRQAPTIPTRPRRQPPAPRDPGRPERRTSPPPPRDEHEIQVGKGERTTLIALAQHEATGCTREQLTILTGYKRSTRNTYLQRLASAVYAAERGGRWHITENGRRYLGDDFEPLPTGDELRAWWLDKLPHGEALTLRVVAAAYPEGVERTEIQAETGYQRSTSNTYIQRLGARELVEARGAGLVVAAEHLFD